MIFKNLFRCQMNPYFKLRWKYAQRNQFNSIWNWLLYTWRGNATRSILYERNYCFRIFGWEYCE